jgi:membrane associated rhomboid family serine protease
MVIPFHDRDPLDRNSTPLVTYTLIAINLAVFLGEFALSPQADRIFTFAAGLVPAAFGGEIVLRHPLPDGVSLVTYMFLHGGWTHLGGNMLFLWVFGDNIEDAVGHLRFLAFYLLCGMAGGAAYLISDPHSTVPLIGASGAISGVVAAYLMMRPCAKIGVLVFWFPMVLAAYWVLGFWVLMQLWHILQQSQDGTAWWAHVGGLLAGGTLILFLRPPGVRLFECVRPL